MTQAIWYFREGGACTTRVLKKTDETGSTNYTPTCGRCGGLGGSDKWERTGWTCFQCGGSGKGEPRFVPVYTTAKLEKLNIARNKVRARKQAKIVAKRAADRKAAQTARGDLFLANEALARLAWTLRKDRFIRDILRQGLGRRILTDGQIGALATATENALKWKAEKEAEAKRKVEAQYVGDIGQRLEAKVTVLKRIIGGDPYSLYGQWVLSILRTAEGSTLTTFGKCRLKEGQEGAIKFTVKAHKKNDKTGERETQITRIKILEPAT
jgi:hypothetical protein